LPWRLAGPRTGRHLVLLAVATVLTVLVVLPLGSVVSNSIFVTDAHGLHVTWQNFYHVATQANYWRSLGDTILISAGSSALATIIGVALAWMMVRTNVPAARLLERLAVLPIFIPPFVGAFAWILLAAPRIGLANVGLRSLDLPEPFNIYTRLGIVWVMGIYMAPYVLMIVASALRSMDPSLEEAGQVSGLNRWRVAIRITLPVVTPAILSGAVLTFVVAIGLFGTPVLLGWPRQILMLTSRIYLESQQVPPAYGVMAVLAVYLMILSTLVVALQQRLVRGRSFVTVTGKGFRTQPIRLGWSRFVLLGVTVIYLVLTVVVPLLVIAAAAASTYAWSGRFTPENFVYLWSSHDVRQTLENSVIIAITAATVAAFLGLCVSWLVCRTSMTGRRLIEYVVLMPLSVPSIAFGIGVAALWLRFPWDIYDTIWLIVIGFVGRFTGYAVRTISGSLVQVHPELEESARICGLGPVRALCRITLPLVRPSIISSWILLYSIFMTELSMVLMLYNADTRTFSILTFDVWYSGYFSRVASLSLLQLFIGVVVMVAVNALAARVAPTESAAAA
jgi:iron(III) transport system permease protein